MDDMSRLPLNHSHTAHQGMSIAMQQMLIINRYQVTAPALLQGHRCYVDASTSPDQPSQQPRMAGLGIFILHLQDHFTEAIYIKAKLQACTSVLMAEAVALALAAVIVQKLNITGINFLSDSEQLVHFLHKEDLANPPDWRIKPFTQLHSNLAVSSSARSYKIHRSLNTTAHSLARQAFTENNTQGNVELSCSSEHHVPQCSYLQALLDVKLHDVLIVAACCC